ncbi:hypothetical protein ACFQJ7_10500 [Halovenus rubra]|uniref:Uncharacterized protein n=2 Tax=Halovenus rubra TaxID=869890 RepID=A0ACC7DXH2_9EURY|nr:hypothetical protein [Halovenus rubra]
MDIYEQLDGTTNVLLAEPPMAQGRDVCTSLLAGQQSNPSVLFVTYTRSPAACLNQLDGHDHSENVGVITVGDNAASIDGVVTESVSTASDLTGLGIAIGQFLSRWDDSVYVCFDSVTSMLQYVDVTTAYEFLHAITGQIHAAGASSHFHIDPNAHDDQDVASITSLFDAKVSLEGETTVRTRELLEPTD